MLGMLKPAVESRNIPRRTAMKQVNAVELIRVSTDAQADKFGIPAQRTANRTTAARYGLKIVKSIELSDVSGSSVLLTPEIQNLIGFIQDPEIGAVVAKEFSRVMRPEKFSDYALLQALVDSRTTLYLPDGPLDLSEKMGRFMGTIRAAVAGLERSEIRDRCMRGKEEMRKAGKWTGAPLPYGVAYNKKTGWHYTEKAKVVLDAMEAVLKGGVDQRELGRRLGIHPSAVKYVLSNPIYSGWRVYAQKCLPSKARADGRQGYSKPVARDEAEVVRVRVIEEPLISEERQERVREILTGRREAHRRSRHNGWATFNGFLFCHRCGHLMTTSRTKRKGISYEYYICINRKQGGTCDQPPVRVDQMETYLNHLLGEYVNSDEFTASLANEAESERSNEQIHKRLDNLESQTRAAQTKRAKIVDAYVDGLYTPEQRDERLKGLDLQVAMLTRELAMLRESLLPQFNKNELAALFHPFREFPLLKRPAKRTLLEVTIPRFRVENGEVVKLYRLLDKQEVAVPAPFLDKSVQPLEERFKNYSSNGRQTGGLKGRGRKANVLDELPAPPGVWIDIPGLRAA
jgi:DNA invertase Pin-like site-specific DNA recombinase